MKLSSFDESRIPLKAGLGTTERTDIRLKNIGAVAQLGERVNGIHEVEGSIPFSSTTFVNSYCRFTSSYFSLVNIVYIDHQWLSE